MIKCILIAIICLILIIIGLHELLATKKDIKEYNEDYDIDGLESLVSTNEAQHMMNWTTEEFYQERRKAYLQQLDSQERKNDKRKFNKRIRKNKRQN